MKDGLDSLSAVVPSAIASAGVRTGARPRGPRPDRPLGKQGTQVLGRVSLFEGLPKRHLRALAERADEVAFRKGERIVEAGERGGAFYVILEGQAKVTKGSRTLARLSAGDFFGELALLDGGPRLASVTATSPVRAIRIFKRSFDRLVAEEPAVAAKMLRVLAARLRDAERSVTG